MVSSSTTAKEHDDSRCPQKIQITLVRVDARARAYVVRVRVSNVMGLPGTICFKYNFGTVYGLVRNV
jgi:hypothetical protein